MLKVSGSLYRYTFQVSDDHTTHVRKIVYFINRKSFAHILIGSLLRKKLKSKIPTARLNEYKRTIPMGDLQPTTMSGSYDKLSIAPTENKTVEDWQKQGSINNSSADNWSNWYSTENKAVEDWRKRAQPNNLSVENWRKQSSTQNRPVENWRKECYSHSTILADGPKSQKPHELLPNFRVWESVGTKSGGNDANTFKFKVMSYNVLAQYLLECHPYLYRECKPNNLQWEVRASRLLEEITILSPDILCLQEVQVSHIDSFYSKFKELGYLGIFKQKTGCRQDGCAVYFKQSVFELEEHVNVEFYQPELPILNRDNIGIMMKLVPHNSPGHPIIVATTHLLYNPKRTDVRLAQIQVFLAEIDRFAYYNKGEEHGHFPIILTGDLNSEPESAVIKLLDNGFVRASPFRDYSDWRNIGVTDNCQHLSVYLNRKEGQSADYSDIKIYNSEYCAPSHTVSEMTEQSATDKFSEMFNGGEIRHNLKLISVYDKRKANGDNEASTFQDYWVTVDYIYFSCNSTLRLVERLRLPTVTECEILGCLPNDVYGSDHLTLAAKFELI